VYLFLRPQRLNCHTRCFQTHILWLTNGAPCVATPVPKHTRSRPQTLHTITRQTTRTKWRNFEHAKDEGGMECAPGATVTVTVVFKPQLL
jgi:hypothetical protein